MSWRTLGLWALVAALGVALAWNGAIPPDAQLAVAGVLLLALGLALVPRSAWLAARERAAGRTAVLARVVGAVGVGVLAVAIYRWLVDRDIVIGDWVAVVVLLLALAAGWVAFRRLATTGRAGEAPGAGGWAAAVPGPSTPGGAPPAPDAGLRPPRPPRHRPPTLPPDDRGVREQTGRFVGAWTAGSLATVGLVPGLIAAFTILVLLLSPTIEAQESSASLPGLIRGLRDLLTPEIVAALASATADVRLAAVVVGPILGILVWLIIGLVATRFAGADQANPTIYQELAARADGLVVPELTGSDATDVLKRQAVDEVLAHQEWVQRQLGTSLGADGRPVTAPATGWSWTTGAGYVGLWQRIHRAEEARLVLLGDQQLQAAALYEQARLAGAKLPEGPVLQRQLAVAMQSLGLRTAIAPEPVPALGETAVPRPVALALLTRVMHTINEFKDDSTAELVRLRRRLTQSLLWTGMVGWLLLALAILAQVSTGMILTAAALYLVAAIAGLLQRIYDDLRLDHGLEDYGLGTARMLLAPLVSGIAGLTGVGLVAIVTSSTGGTGIGGGGDDLLAHTFDLAENPFAVVAAAVFGLAPGVLLRRLQQIGTEIQLDIKSAGTTGSGTGGGTNG